MIPEKYPHTVTQLDGTGKVFQNKREFQDWLSAKGFKDMPVWIISKKYGVARCDNRPQMIHWLEQHGYNDLEDFLSEKD